MAEAIKGFFKEYRWLSNFHLVRILYEGIEYPSSEAAYQAGKTLDKELRKEFAALPTPNMARKLGQKIELRPGWFEMKPAVMEEVLRIKFSNPELKEKLLATGDAYLEETNTWHDNFYGFCTCDKCKDKEHQNTLGKILMKIREDLRKTAID